MSPFADFTFAWKGKEYRVPGDQFLPALERIEEVITAHEMWKFTKTRGTIPISKVSRAFTSLLNGCGADDKWEDVYKTMMSAETDNASAEQAMVIINTLFAFMMPDAKTLGVPEMGEGNRQARRAATSLSKKRTKRPAAGG